MSLPIRLVASLGVLSCCANMVFGEPVPRSLPIHDAIDKFIESRITQEQIVAASQASDANFVRRVTLDLAGRIPAAIEVQQYVDSEASDKRERLVDRLMASDEFNNYLSAVFNQLITQGDGDIRNYLRDAFQQNRGWDQIFRDVLTGDLRDPPVDDALDFLKRRVKDTDRLTNDVAATFLGINVSCAKCHDHPLVLDWTQDHFYGMKSFFARTFDNGGFVAERDFGTLDYNTTDGEKRRAKLMFLTGYVVEPKVVELSRPERKKRQELFKKLKKEKQQPPPPRFSLREQLVNVALDDRQNHFFAKAIVNHVWYQFFGHGFVMPLDQMHSENPPSHPELLEWLWRDLVQHEYDLKRLIRGIVLSWTYSRTSGYDGADRPRPSLFAVALPRPLTPIQIARSLHLATHDPSEFREISSSPKGRDKIVRAARESVFEIFEYPGEDFRVGAQEALWFSNSKQFQDEFLKGGLVEHLREMEDRRQMIRVAVWSVLSRPATNEDISLLEPFVIQREDRPEDACRHLVWALLASSEFRFNY